MTPCAQRAPLTGHSLAAGIRLPSRVSKRCRRPVSRLSKRILFDKIVSQKSLSIPVS